MGGGFGNKDEGRLGVIAALLAQRAGRPVRIEYTREEEFVAGRTRHPSESQDSLPRANWVLPTGDSNGSVHVTSYCGRSICA